MKPRIAAITGKLEDTVISMNEGPVLIGRQAGATLKIGSASVSRRHAIIEKEGEHFIIADLGSRNGTFVNDVPVKRRELQHGDRVRIGDSQFFFLFEEGDEPVRTDEIRFDDSEIGDGKEVRMTFDEVMGTMARDLSVLMKVSRVINGVSDLRELQEGLLALLLEAVPARRGVFLLTDDPDANATEFSSIIGLNRAGIAGLNITVSRSIVRRVLTEKSTLLVADTGKSEVSETTSIMAAGSRSLLCVPLVLCERPLGAIYLDTDDPEVHFDQDHLQLTTAVAAFAAAPIENARQAKRVGVDDAKLQEATAS